MQSKDELNTWRNAAIVIVLVAGFVFLSQRFFGRFFVDPVFDICIFYVPAFVSVILYLYQRRRL